MQARLFTPDEGEFGIVLVHEVYGPDPHLHEVATRFAGEGFHVLVPDLYSREGRPGPAPSEAEPAPTWSLEQIRSAVAGLPDRRAVADLDGALAFLGEQDGVDARSLAVVGFCMGGTLAFLSGCISRRVACVVDFYGGPIYRELGPNKPSQPLELALNLDRPLLAFFGEADDHIPAEHVERLRRMLESSAKSFEIHTYPDVGHGFFNHQRPGYDADAASHAWSKTLSFLREVL